VIESEFGLFDWMYIYVELVVCSFIILWRVDYDDGNSDDGGYDDDDDGNDDDDGGGGDDDDDDGNGKLLL
jgi:hypothetical protein